MQEHSTTDTNVLAPDYRYTKAANYIRQCLISGKASSLKEAYQLCDNYLDNEVKTAQMNRISSVINYLV